MPKILLFSLIGFALFKLSLIALVIDPPGVKLFSQAGKDVEGYITLKNEKAVPIELEVTFRNSSLTADKFPGWLALTPQKFSLNPDEEKKLHYKVSVSKEATGQFLGIISFDEIVKDEKKQMLGVRTRISIYIATTIEGTEVYAGKIQSIKLNPSKQDQFNVLVENEGNVYVKTKGQCTIKSVATGEMIAEFTVNPKMAPVYANKTRNLIGKMDSPLRPGDYEVIVEFPFPDDDHLISKTISLNIPEDTKLDQSEEVEDHSK